MANSYPRYANSAAYEDPSNRRFRPSQSTQSQQQHQLQQNLKQETPPQDWGYIQQQPQHFKQETPPHDWVGYDDLGLPNPQFPSSATTLSAGSPQWGNNYVATGQQSYPATTGYEVDATNMVHAGLYGFTGQYSGVEVDPTQITITDGGIQPQLYGGTLYDPTMPVGDFSQAGNPDIAAAYSFNTGMAPMFPDDSSFAATNLGFHDTSLSPDYMSPPINDTDQTGLALYDNPIDDDFGDLGHLNQWNPSPPLQQKTRDQIRNWFNTHYAFFLGTENIPDASTERPNQNGDVECKLCRPSKMINYNDYKTHKLDFHGLKRDKEKRPITFQPPNDVREQYTSNGVLGFEGFCISCRNWIALDTGMPHFNWSQHVKQCQDTIMGRYISSGDEDEDVKEKARKHPPLSYTGPTHLHPKPSGIPSSSNSDNSWSSISDNSSQSASSVISGISNRSLQGRRKAALRIRARKTTKRDPHGDKEDKKSRPYQCTFCNANFSSFGDWKRHEENIHLVLSKWVCAPMGMFKPNSIECVYCDEPHPQSSGSGGIATKCNASYCHSKAPEDRVFSRKDHLKQHLRKIHGVGWKDAFEKWSVRSQGPNKSRCGFCGATFDVWKNRMQHVGFEFKSGHDMKYWQGDWGLDDYWMSPERLGGAMLPEERDDHVKRASGKRNSITGSGISSGTGSVRRQSYNPAKAALKPISGTVKSNAGPIKGGPIKNTATLTSNGGGKPGIRKKRGFDSLRPSEDRGNGSLGRGDHYSIASTHGDADVEDNSWTHQQHQQQFYASPPLPEPTYHPAGPHETSPFTPVFNPTTSPTSYDPSSLVSYANQLMTPPDSTANVDSDHTHLDSSPLYHQQQQQQQASPLQHQQQRVRSQSQQKSPMQQVQAMRERQERQKQQQQQAYLQQQQQQQRQRQVSQARQEYEDALGLGLGLQGLIGGGGGGGGGLGGELRGSGSREWVNPQMGVRYEVDDGFVSNAGMMGVGVGGGGGGQAQGRGGRGGEKRFVCFQCGGKFVSQDALRVHGCGEA